VDDGVTGDALDRLADLGTPDASADFGGTPSIGVDPGSFVV
jgi:hypothetical protein